MFGTLKLRGCCAPESKDLHQRYYCGLCQAMGHGYGQPLRAFHSHDGVFVALVADGVLAEAAEQGTTACPMLPVLRKPSLDPGSASQSYAAAIQLLLGDQWLADRQADGGRLAGAGRRLLSGRVARARAQLEDLGVDLAELDGFEGRQVAAERPDAELEVAAEPTARALELVFASIADLPGAGGADRSGLGRLGRVLGQTIYRIDALEDLDDDARTGAFNPCLEQGEVDVGRVEAAIERLGSDLAELLEVAGALPLRRNRELVVEILGPSLSRRAQAAIRSAREACSGAARAERARWSESSAAVRLVRAAALLLLSFWTFLVGLPEALAGGQRQTSTYCEDCLEKCCGDCCDKCGESCSACDGCGDSCKGCGDSCGGCGEACEGCCNSCPGAMLFFRR